MTADGWYVQLPNYEGHVSDLQMVLGADILCELIANDLTEITVTVSDEPFEHINFSTREYILDFVNSTTNSTGEQDGANYRLREYKLDVWLCNVTKYVFGEFPVTIYIRV